MITNNDAREAYRAAALRNTSPWSGPPATRTLCPPLLAAGPISLALGW
jgi:hypothetical protein